MWGVAFLLKPLHVTPQAASILMILQKLPSQNHTVWRKRLLKHSESGLQSPNPFEASFNANMADLSHLQN